MNKYSVIGAVVLALNCSSPALAHFTKLDDFQREPSTNMGPNWQENKLYFSIVKADSTNNVAQANPPPKADAFMEYVGNLQDLSATNDWFAVTVIHGPEQPEHVDQYAGLVLRYADPADSVLVALQDNNRDGRFDHISFSRGLPQNEPKGKNKWSKVSPIKPTSVLTIRARIADDFSHPGMLQVIVQLDGNHNGIWGEPEDDTLVHGNLKPTGLGTGVGLAGTGGAEMDNFGGYTPIIDEIPEPATLVMLIWGGLAFRRRLHRPSL